LPQKGLTAFIQLKDSLPAAEFSPESRQ